MSVNGNPRLDHDPTRSPVSVHAVMLTDEGAEELPRVAECFGVEVVVRRVDELTEEQKLEQARLLGRLGHKTHETARADLDKCPLFLSPEEWK